MDKEKIIRIGKFKIVLFKDEHQRFYEFRYHRVVNWKEIDIGFYKYELSIDWDKYDRKSLSGCLNWKRMLFTQRLQEQLRSRGRE